MAIRRIDLLSCGNLDKTPMKTLDFDAREFSTMGRSMLLLAWEKIKEAILCLPLFMFSTVVTQHITNTSAWRC